MRTKDERERRSGAIIQAAKKYVDQQLATMRKHGTLSKLTEREYNELVSQVVEATVK
jgi:hypothetical protein